MQRSEDQLKMWMVEGLDGDAAAYAALLRALVPLLRGFYLRRLGNAEDVEDLVQDTLIAIHTRRMSYDRQRLFTAWLFAVARYKMIDRFRRMRRTTSMEGLEDILAAECFDDATNAQIDVNRLLAELPEKQSALIRKTRIEGHSVSEVADETGFGESDVKVSVHRGLKAITARILGERR